MCAEDVTNLLLFISFFFQSQTTITKMTEIQIYNKVNKYDQLIGIQWISLQT